MKPFTGTGDERYQQFDGYWSLASCGSVEEVSIKLKDLYSAIDNEQFGLSLVRYAKNRARGLSAALAELVESRENEKLEMKK